MSKPEPETILVNNDYSELGVTVFALCKYDGRLRCFVPATTWGYYMKDFVVGTKKEMIEYAKL